MSGCVMCGHGCAFLIARLRVKDSLLNRVRGALIANVFYACKLSVQILLLRKRCGEMTSRLFVPLLTPTLWSTSTRNESYLPQSFHL